MARKYHQGKYTPKNPKKYVGDVMNIIYRSSWEKKAFIRFDLDPNILAWGSETFHVPYFSKVDGKMRRYFPDIIVKYKNTRGDILSEIIEIKPYKETIPPKKTGGKNSKSRFINAQITWQRNQDKWEACKAFAESKGMTFRTMNEYDLGIKKRK